MKQRISNLEREAAQLSVPDDRGAAEQLIALLPDWPENLIEFPEFSYPDEPRTVEEVKQWCREILARIQSGEIEPKHMAIMRSFPVPVLLGISNQKCQ